MISITINAAKKIGKKGVICPYIYIWLAPRRACGLKRMACNYTAKDKTQFQCLLPEERKVQQK